ncbi:MAG: thiamine pyrophosphate-binding protein [Flavobacteriaceae bacterium]
MSIATREDASVKGYAVLAELLVGAGMDTLFGLMGEVNLDLVAYLRTHHGMRYVAARHEAGAIAMADGYARASGRIGYTTVTCGPGLTNALTAIISAVRNRARILVITGQLPPSERDRSQLIDQTALLAGSGAPIVNVTDGADLASGFARALAQVERSYGPVVLNVDIPVLNGVAPRAGATAQANQAAKAAKADSSKIGALARMLAEASRPVILAGRGAVEAGAGQALRRLAEKSGAKLATSLLGHGLFAGHGEDVGICGGFSGRLNVQVMQEADLVVVFGAGLNGWTTRAGTAFPQARVAWCDSDPAAFGKASLTPELAIVGDAREVAEAVAEAIGAAAGNAKAGSAAPEPEHVNYVQRDGVIDPRLLCAVLDKMLPAARTIALDGGHFMEFPCRGMTVPDEKGFLFSLGFGAVGIGLATAIGAAVARPDRLTVCFVGDGGLMMALQELDTAVRARARLLVVVMNDGAYGAEVKHLVDHGWDVKFAQFDNPDFVAVAAALGCAGSRVADRSTLERLREPLQALEGPYLIDARVDPEVRADWMQIMHEARVSK